MEQHRTSSAGPGEETEGAPASRLHVDGPAEAEAPLQRETPGTVPPHAGGLPPPPEPFSPAETTRTEPARVEPLLSAEPSAARGPFLTEPPGSGDAPVAAPDGEEVPSFHAGPVLTAVPEEHLAPGAAVPAAHRAADEREDRAHEDGHPNWMLAFVCAWAGGTSLFEAFQVAKGASPPFAVPTLLGSTFLGYTLLGAGLLLFAWDAVQWGRHRRKAALIAALIVPTLVTLAGAILLLISHDPGRRI